MSAVPAHRPAARENPELCPDCLSELDRSQPDPARPDRVLGACTGCGAWFLLSDPGGPVRVVGPG